MKKIRVVVDTLLPEGASLHEVAVFVSDALQTWGGQLRPPGALGDDDEGDPLFSSLRVEAVTVKQQRR